MIQNATGGYHVNYGGSLKGMGQPTPDANVVTNQLVMGDGTGGLYGMTPPFDSNGNVGTRDAVEFETTAGVRSVLNIVSQGVLGVGVTHSATMANQTGTFVAAGFQVSVGTTVASAGTCNAASLYTRKGVTDATSATPGTTAAGGGSYSIAIECTYNATGAVYTWIID